MAKASENAQIAMLQAQVRDLTNLVNRLVGRPVVSDTGTIGKSPDFIEFGSKEHAAILGIIEIGSQEEALPGEIVFQSPGSKKWYKLEDSITPFLSYPNPTVIAALTLRQKVNTLESGAPVVPDDSPDLMTFNDPDLERVVAIGAMFTPE